MDGNCRCALFSLALLGLVKVPVNPILPLWEHVPDLEPHVFGDRLYIYGSHDQANAWDFCLGDYVGWSAPTNDLGNWRYEGTIFAKADDPENVTGNDALYAPDVARGPDGRYYLFYQRDNTSAQKDGAAHLGVAVCDKPVGRYRHLGYVRRADGSLYGDRTGDNGFDPSVLVDDDGRIYLYVGVGSKGARAYELRGDMLTIAREFGQVIPGRGHGKGTSFEGHAFVEASSVRKIDGRYVFVYSAEIQPQLCYATGPAPWGPFVYRGVLNRSTCGGNHGGLVRIGNDWFVTRQRNTHGTNFSRQCCAEKLGRAKDGRFIEAPCTSQGFSEGPLPARDDYPAGITFDSGHLVRQLGEGLDSDVFIGGFGKGVTVGFRYFDFRGVGRMSVVMRGWAQGAVEVRVDNPKGAVVGRIPTKRTNTWARFAAEVAIPDGAHEVYLTFQGACMCGQPQLKAFGFEPRNARLNSTGDVRRVFRVGCLREVAIDGAAGGELWIGQ